MPTPTMDRSLVDALLRQVPEEGLFATAAEGIGLVRSNRPTARQPIVYQPVFYVVLQGRKCSYLGDETYTYDPLHFLALSVPLPMAGHVTQATPEAPYLALKIDIHAAMVRDVLAAMPELPPHAAGSRGVCVCPLSDDMLQAVARLLPCLSDPARARVLAPLMVKEAIFYALQGPQGAQLAAFVTQGRQQQRIARVIDHIHAHFAEALDIDTLAGLAHMSPSTLHQHFKAVTRASPGQYVKALRLHHARELVLAACTPISEAAHRVGYQSLSQFSREYKRLFGQAPSARR